MALQLKLSNPYARHRKSRTSLPLGQRRAIQQHPKQQRSCCARHVLLAMTPVFHCYVVIGYKRKGGSATKQNGGCRKTWPKVLFDCKIARKGDRMVLPKYSMHGRRDPSSLCSAQQAQGPRCQLQAARQAAKQAERRELQACAACSSRAADIALQSRLSLAPAAGVRHHHHGRRRKGARDTEGLHFMQPLNGRAASPARVVLTCTDDPHRV